MSNIINFKPSIYQEVADQQVRRYSMMEEYNFIMKNDVWDIVPRLEGKSVVSSKWLYNIKQGADGNIENYKERFVVRGGSVRRE